MKLITLRLISGLLGTSLPLSLLAAEQPPPAARGASAASVAAAGLKLDLNTADFKTLESVPEIGTDVARAIIAARPFATVDELDRVKGINTEQLEQIRARVMVSTPPPVPRNRDNAAKASRSTQNPSTQGTPKKKVDVNTADLKTLESIPAIGADMARAIVAARPFSSIDELDRLQGLSAERLEQIRAELAVFPQTAGKKTSKPAGSDRIRP